MTKTGNISEASLEVMEAEGGSRAVPVSESPFQIGRGADSGNHLQLDDRRVSRRSAALLCGEDGVYQLQDLGQRNGLHLNGAEVKGTVPLRDGDVITFGKSDLPRLVFHRGPAHDAIPELLSRLDQSTAPAPDVRGLHQLSLLLEATTLLQARMPMEEVLAAMVDRAVAVTQADRGLLLEADEEGELKPLVARQSGGANLPLSAVSPSQTAVAQALQQRHSVMATDVALSGGTLREAQSVVAQQLRSVIAIPLQSMARMHAADMTSGMATGELLGVLYLDSRRPAAFSQLERQILDALAVEATSVIENARLLAKERERRRLEQELNIARDIQQALLPKDFKSFSYLEISGVNRSCYEVGGDYFDLIEAGPNRAAFVIADVSGKGISAALVTAIVQGSFAGMTLSQDPTQLFNHVNRFICTRSAASRYATLFFGLFDSDGRFEFINAGHHSPLRVRGGKVDQPFPSECLPLGLLADAEFKLSSTTLKPGDTLIFFTDGVSEALDVKQEEFGLDRLRQVVAAHTTASVEELQTAILAALDEFAHDADQADDITLLILRYKAQAAASRPGQAPLTDTAA